MKKKVAGTLATGFFIKLLLLQVATACPSNLQCTNFTESDKLRDCNYIWSQSSGTERQEALCILWDQGYDFLGYQNKHYPRAQANFTFHYKEIETSRFILFSKIIIFLIFNYLLFSVLTKNSFIRKCLPAV
ncbi:MAG: hypothetical protein AABW89_05555 [Nanoarchaeota archaeon]